MTRIRMAPAMEQVHTVLMTCTTDIDAQGSALPVRAPASVSSQEVTYDSPGSRTRNELC